MNERQEIEQITDRLVEGERPDRLDLKNKRIILLARQLSQLGKKFSHHALSYEGTDTEMMDKIEGAVESWRALDLQLLSIINAFGV